MRMLWKLAVLLVSILHRVVMLVVNAHINVIANLFSRHPDADRPRAVKRG